MNLRVLAYFLIFLPGLAVAQDIESCTQAGPRISFCAEHQFNRMDVGQTDGISLWLHQGGYLTKLVVQKDPHGHADRARVETQIMSIVASQAQRMGRAFDFADLASAQMDGYPYGTLSYALSAGASEQHILHSYVVAEDVVVQVITQIALERAKHGSEALQSAHADALRAVQMVADGSNA